MKPRIKVMKFGGTSVATPEARAAAAEHVIQAKEQGFSPMVVVSAIGRKGQPYATDTLIGELKSVDSSTRPDARELDLMAACGEIFSAVIFTQTLRSMGHEARSLRGGQAGIRTDGVFGNARIVGVAPSSMLKAVSEGVIPVICGFQGTFSIAGEPGGELTTLGRGGSDTTAAAVGAAVEAESVEIYTDVDGVKTADPDFVENAPTLPKVSYEEVAELAHLGAKVLHPRAAEIAMKYGIPLWVKSTFSDAPGTLVVNKEQVGARKATGVTHSGKLVYLEFDLRGTPEHHATKLQACVYDMMARYALNVYMVNLNPSTIGFAVPRDQYATVQDLLDGLVTPFGDPATVYMLQIGAKPSKEAETQLELLKPLGDVHVVPLLGTENCTIVSLVGSDLVQQPGVYPQMLRCLNEAGITVLQTSDSELSISCLIPEAEMRRAVALLHASFGLHEVCG